jgi:putative transposase
MTARKLDRALRDTAKSNGAKRRGFPRFKKYSDRADAFSFVGREVRMEDGRIRLPRIGWLRVRGLSLPADAVMKQVSVMQEPNGWHVSIQFEAMPKLYAAPTKPMVGIDAGLLDLAVLSDGSRVTRKREDARAARYKRRFNRERDRRKKGGVNRKRTIAKLGRLHRHVADARKDYIHKATRKLVDTYEGFAVEDLSFRGMMKTRMAASLADAGLGAMLRILRYKAEWAGRTWAVYPRFFRSTGVCPSCSHVGLKLPLSVREWVCTCCGVVLDRDVAAAQIILRGAVGQARCPNRRRPRESEALPFVAGNGREPGLVTAGHFRILPKLDKREPRSTRRYHPRDKESGLHP